MRLEIDKGKRRKSICSKKINFLGHLGDSDNYEDGRNEFILMSYGTENAGGASAWDGQMFSIQLFSVQMYTYTNVYLVVGTLLYICSPDMYTVQMFIVYI